MKIFKFIFMFFLVIFSYDVNASWYKNSEQSVRYSLRFYPQVTRLCKVLKCKYPIRPKLIIALLSVETGYPSKTCHISSAGAKGWLQLKEIAKRDVKEKGDLCNSDVNFLVGIKYLMKLHNDYRARTWLEVAVMYNEGPGGAKKYIKNPRLMYKHPYLKKVKTALEHMIKFKRR